MPYWPVGQLPMLPEQARGLLREIAVFILDVHAESWNIGFRILHVTLQGDAHIARY
ncbi:hypothetical protein GCM10012285_64150 [Streptomyces kronopolitis]|uniref:Uncharacterized protein n=1 Tax=Streptomyces kronopolitis TaxID=1612435 RepID=A0ABQ2K3X4_9ACTN|nr:hypothetical protein GCM10012285_64150 [Streptomyces kronopolitis]